MLARLFRLIVILNLALASPAFPRGKDGGGYGGDAGTSLSNTTTKRLTRTLTAGVQACFRLEKVYRYDCYRQTYRLAANQLNGMPPYSDAQKVLIEVEQTLEQIVSRNVDPQTPPVRRGVQRYRPIKPAALPQAKEQFVQALEEAETKLLRSPQGNNVHYARIAQAINSNKVLLRSALLPVAPAAVSVRLARVLLPVALRLT